MFMKRLTGPVICNYDDPVTDTKYGKVRGLKTDGTYIFRGIKYCDSERFHMPVEVQPWEGVKEAYQFGYACREISTPIPHDQFNVPHMFYPQSEDCQYLNIWTQTLDKKAKKPVMVWFHGGGWFSGSGYEIISYDGENLSQFGDVVVVTLNHRLNMLGYLDLSDFGEEYAKSNLVGMADLIMSLKWIHENIENFGGDPDNVMIMGQSGGTTKVINMLQCPAADGLFHKMSVQSSGGILSMGGPEGVERRRYINKKVARIAVERLGLTKETIKEIETVDWYDLADAVAEAVWIVRNEENYTIKWEPLPDFDYFYGHPMDYDFREESKNIPILIGSIFGEANTNFNIKIGDDQKNTWDEATTLKYLDERYGKEKAAELIPLFKKAYPTHKLADLLYIDNARRAGYYKFCKKRIEGGGAPVYNWMLTLESPFFGGTIPWHNAEEPFMFHNIEYIEAQYIPGVTEKLQDQMAGSWVNFAKTNVPSYPTLPEWPECTADEMHTMIFDRECEVLTNYDKELAFALPTNNILHRGGTQPPTNFGKKPADWKD